MAEVVFAFLTPVWQAAPPPAPASVAPPPNVPAPGGITPYLVPTTESTVIRDRVRSVIDSCFSQSNLPVSQSASKLYRIVGGGTIVASQIPLVVAYRGSVLALTLSASDNKTAGTAIFTVYVNNAATGASLTWSNSTSSGFASFPAGLYPLSAGDKVDVRVTTNGTYAPTTAEVEILLYLSQNPEVS
jgi:hypothetical protein